MRRNRRLALPAAPFRYGQLIYRGARLLAHRASYLAFIGDIEPGQVIRHTCDEGACVNPAHLRIGTQAENMADMVDRGRGRNQYTSPRSQPLPVVGADGAVVEWT